jgi:antitoxin component YwqK of YwqJK toxin-antitoxin module
MRTSFTLCFIVIYVLISCRDVSQSTPEWTVKKTFHPEGGIMIEQVFVNDSVADGYFKQYFPNGRIELQANYKDGFKDGEQISFYESGKQESTVPFVHGNKNGLAKWFYESGVLKTKLGYFKDKVAGEMYNYYPNGELQRYVCLDFDEQVRFEMKYSENGNVLSRLGEGLIYANADELNLDIGDTLKLFALVATPPDCTYRMEITTDVKSSEKLEVPIDEENSVYEYQKVVAKEGKFRFVGTYYLKYKDGTESHETFAGDYEVVKSPSQ